MALVDKVLGWERAWNRSITTVAGLRGLLIDYLLRMKEGEMAVVLKKALGRQQPTIECTGFRSPCSVNLPCTCVRAV